VDGFARVARGSTWKEDGTAPPTPRVPYAGGKDGAGTCFAKREKTRVRPTHTPKERETHPPPRPRRRADPPRRKHRSNRHETGGEGAVETNGSDPRGGTNTATGIDGGYHRERGRIREDSQPSRPTALPLARNQTHVIWNGGTEGKKTHEKKPRRKPKG